MDLLYHGCGAKSEKIVRKHESGAEKRLVKADYT
jgi:hypothetical protein